MEKKCFGVPAGGLMVNVQQPGEPTGDELATNKLEKSRKIYMDYDVCEDTLAIQRQIMVWNMEDMGVPKEERKPIWLYIFSFGGQLDVMKAMVDTITLSETPVYTVDIGVAASAASLIFLAGHKRFMLPNSELVIHEGSAEMAGDAGKLFDNVDAYRAEVKKMKDYILSVTKIPAATMRKKASDDWHVSAQDCLKYGACERIIESLDEVI